MSQPDNLGGSALPGSAPGLGPLLAYVPWGQDFGELSPKLINLCSCRL